MKDQIGSRSIASACALALLLLAQLPGSARGQAVYKCVAKGRPPSYQSQPCPSSSRIAAIREYRPEAPPTHEQLLERRRREAQGRQDSAYLSRIAGTDRQAGRQRDSARGHVLPTGGNACESAKRDRDAWERRVGLSRSYDALRAWNDTVHRACR
ncbi:hypothetical protein ACFQZQ_02245 [Lysobacter koreensis]|uniref:DUF4124 domain-containing protein n=1 Tax=Lysobacter koreensis TaxID=266122 RepID=A0ABW2YMR6_9GAMM